MLQLPDDLRKVHTRPTDIHFKVNLITLDSSQFGSQNNCSHAHTQDWQIENCDVACKPDIMESPLLAHMVL